VDANEWTLPGTRSVLAARTWPNPHARWLAILVHGYGEHVGRYQHVADALVHGGAVVVGADHMGHGRSTGERVLLPDLDDVVADVHEVAEVTGTSAGSLPKVLIGHSLGGLVSVRYAQRYRETLAAMVLSAPVLGSWPALDLLASLEIPDQPIDPGTLSRDPAVADAYRDDPLVWHGPFKRATLEAIDRSLQTANEAGVLEDLPVLWVHGDEDELVPVADTRTGIDRIRGSAFEERIYPGARHELFNETNRDEVLADVVAFLHRVFDETFPAR